MSTQLQHIRVTPEGTPFIAHRTLVPEPNQSSLSEYSTNAQFKTPYVTVYESDLGLTLQLFGDRNSPDHERYVTITDPNRKGVRIEPISYELLFPTMIGKIYPLFATDGARNIWAVSENEVIFAQYRPSAILGE